MSDLTQGLLLGIGLGWIGMMLNLGIFIWYVRKKMKKD